jgi:MFS family permease
VNSGGSLSDKIRHAAGMLALNRSTLGIFAMVILVGMGEKMAERFLPIYLISLGGGAMVVGLMQAMDNLLSAVYVYPGGYLSDRIGTKKSLLVFNLVAITGFGLVVLIPSWQAVIIGAALFISWSAISLPATMNLMYRILPENKRTMGVSVHALVRRIPMAAGPVIGGFFILRWGEQEGVRLAFVLAFVLAVAALILQQKMIPDDQRPAVPEQAKSSGSVSHSPWTMFKKMRPAMKKLLAADILIRFCEQMPYAFVVIWCMKIVAQPVNAMQFGFLTAIEMTTAILVYIPVAWFAGNSAKKPFVMVTFVLFTLFPLILLYSQSFPSLVFAFFVRGLQEFGEPTRKALIMDLAPDYCRGAMFGLYYLIRDFFVAAAALIGALIWQKNPEFCLIAAFCFGVAGSTGYAFFGTDLSTDSSNKEI